MKAVNRSLLKALLPVTGAFLLATVLSLQLYLLGIKTVFPDGTSCTHYNNYLIFRQSFHHLAEGKDLYQPHPGDHYDFFKYSPSFAFLMAPFAALPIFPGLWLWTFLNAWVLAAAFRKLPFPSGNIQLAAFGFILIELIGSLQNSQSNALIAGLLIAGFHFMEKRKPLLASLMIVLTVFIKVFGFLGLAMFLLYPGKRKAVLYSAGWIMLLAIAPLAVLSHGELMSQYRSWVTLLAHDHREGLGLSVMGWLHSWFGLQAPKGWTVLAGAVLLLLPLAVKYRSYAEPRFRILFLSSLLIWGVIFNHMAESPTFIIAVTGIAAWFFTRPEGLVNYLLVALAFILTVLSPTDLFPAAIRSEMVIPYVLKVVPCIFIWCKVTWDLLSYR